MCSRSIDVNEISYEEACNRDTCICAEAPLNWKKNGRRNM